MLLPGDRKRGNARAQRRIDCGKAALQRGDPIVWALFPAAIGGAGQFQWRAGACNEAACIRIVDDHLQALRTGVDSCNQFHLLHPVMM
ncbi:hypothetical protein D3C73_1321700 [compost metagenome]